MCPHSSWQKVPKGSWSRSMSPFEHQLIDLRTYGSSLESLEVSIEEEFVKYHVTFLILGIIMMSLASLLSKSLVFYYGIGMANWGSPCNIDGTFSGDGASPNWSKNSLAIFVYSSVVGLGSFLLGYLPGLLHTLLTEIGISDNMYNPEIVENTQKRTTADWKFLILHLLNRQIHGYFLLLSTPHPKGEKKEIYAIIFMYCIMWCISTQSPCSPRKQ